MNYEIKVNEVRKDEGSLRGFANVTIEGSFKITNIAILENRTTGECFVSMPRYKTSQVDESGKDVYQDICYPVTKEFREKLYGDILKTYEEVKEKNREEFEARMKEQEKDSPIKEEEKEKKAGKKSK